MKIKILLLYFMMVLLTPVLISAQIRTNGYLAAEYIKSQELGAYPGGNFQNSLFGFVISGQLSTRVSFLAEVSLIQGSDIEISQAWVGLQSSRYFNLKMGLYQVPFGFYNENNLPHQTVFINPPLNINYLFPFTWREIGVVAEGMLSGLNYTLYTGNGLAEGEYLNLSQQFQDNNANKSVGGRFRFPFGSGVDAAYSYYRGKYDNEDNRNLILQGVNVVWDADSVILTFEYTRARIENPEGFSEAKADGYFIQSVVSIGSLRPVVSYQTLTYNDDFHGAGFFDSSNPGSGISFEKNRWTLGVVYTISQNMFFKFEYDFNLEDDNSVEDNMYSFQVALSF